MLIDRLINPVKRPNECDRKVGSDLINLYEVSRQNLPLSKQFVEEFLRLVGESSFILRKEVFDFESQVKKYLNSQSQVIGVNSGTDALFLALQYSQIGFGNEVLVPSRTYIASVSAIVHTKSIPVFVDIKDDLSLDLDDLESKITDKTRAIMAVHLSGHACNMTRLIQIAQRYNLVVIEDAAPALGSKFDGTCVGTFGDFGIISLHPLKSLSVLGDGGLLLAKNIDLADKIRVFRDHGHPQPKMEENYSEFGINSRLDNFQAAIASIKLKHFDSWIRRRREIAKRYSQALLSTAITNQAQRYLENLNQASRYFDTFNSFILSVEHPDSLKKFMSEGPNPVEVQSVYQRPIHNHPNLIPHLGQKDPVVLPKTEYFARRTVSIPIYPELTDSEVEIICDKLHRYKY